MERPNCLESYNVYLYNPITREYRILPSTITPHRVESITYQGFGFDTSSNDYKVITIHGRYDAEVYKLSTNRWSRLLNLDMGDISYMCTSCVYVSGCCYWRLYDFTGTPPGRILAFNFQTETFGVIRFPADKIGKTTLNDLGVLDDSLALCRVVKFSNNTIGTQVWIKSECSNSWTNKFTIRSADLVMKYSTCWVSRDKSYVCRLDPDSEEVKIVGTKEEETKDRKAMTRLFRFDCTKQRAMVFKPSLVSLHSGCFMKFSGY